MLRLLYTLSMRAIVAQNWSSTGNLIESLFLGLPHIDRKDMRFSTKFRGRYLQGYD